MTVLEQVDGSTAAQSHGPGSSDGDLIRSQAPKMNNREAPFCFDSLASITKWINDLGEKANMPADNRLVTLHCEAGSVSVRLVFETRAKCQDFIARKRMMVSLMH